MKRRGGLALCLIALGGLFALFLRTSGGQENTALAQAQPMLTAPPVATPTVVAVGPGQAPNNLDVTLTLTGTDFHAVLSGTEVLTVPTVSLDSFVLPAVGWISSTALTATVPWGLDAGVYTVTVTNPDGGAGCRPSACGPPEVLMAATSRRWWSIPRSARPSLRLPAA